MTQNIPWGGCHRLSLTVAILLDGYVPFWLFLSVQLEHLPIYHRFNVCARSVLLRPQRRASSILVLSLPKMAFFWPEDIIFFLQCQQLAFWGLFSTKKQSLWSHGHSCLACNKEGQGLSKSEWCGVVQLGWAGPGRVWLAPGESLGWTSPSTPTQPQSQRPAPPRTLPDSCQEHRLKVNWPSRFRPNSAAEKWVGFESSDFTFPSVKWE